MKVNVITSCNHEQYDVFGRNMAESYVKYWPLRETELFFYNEDIEEEEAIPLGVEVCEFPLWHDAFKARHVANLDANGRDRSRNRPKCPEYDFKRDCVRFSHKVAAFTDAAQLSGDMLIWMDADTVTTEKLSVGWLAEQFPGDGLIAWLDRAKVYPECGFFMLRRSHPSFGTFINRMRELYASDGVLRMSETHDSYVIEQTIMAMMQQDLIPPPHSLSGKAGYQSSDPFSFSPLAAKFKHLKGKKKYARA